MVRHLAATVPASLLATALATMAPADAAEGWRQPLPAYGTAAMVCDDSEENVRCFGLRCGNGRPLEFLFISTGDGFDGPTPGRIAVDGAPVATLIFEPRPIEAAAMAGVYEGVSPFDAAAHGTLVDRLRAGSRMVLDFENPRYPAADPSPLDMSLRGSSREIARVLAACPAPTSAPPSAASAPAGHRFADAAAAQAAEIADACSGRPGRFEPDGVIEADLTGDGREDLALSHEAIVCEGAEPRSLLCGMRTCYFVVHVATDDGLERRHEGLSIGLSLEPGSPPRLRLVGNDLVERALVWTGSEFDVTSR